MKRVLSSLFVLLLLCLALLAAGCGSKKSAQNTTTFVRVLPDATTPAEWADRIVNIFLRPLNQDLGVVSGFNNPQIKLYIASQNPTTLHIINTRMNDLKRCTSKLTQIGPPPKGDPRLNTINAKFHRACADYEVVADELLKATPFLSSGRSDVIQKGEDMIRSVRDESGRAADNLAAAVRIAQRLHEFRRAGLKPSV
jgi:hypothetical protein